MDIASINNNKKLMNTLQARLQYLDGYDFEYLRSRYTEDHPEYATFFDEAVEELRKFYKLTTSSAGPLAVLSKKVDALWHTHVLHTPQYRRFSDELLGTYIDHQPHSEQTPVPGEAITNFYREYAEHFGEVPTIWQEDIPGEYVGRLRAGELPSQLLATRWSGWPGV